MEMFKVGDEVELDLNSPMFIDVLDGTIDDEVEFCKDMGLIPGKVYKIIDLDVGEDEYGTYTFIRLEGAHLGWSPDRFKHAVTTLENE